MLSLRELQLRFFGVLCAETAEAGAPAAASAPPDSLLLEAISGDSALGAAERLGIYAGMYRTRLLDVLREDFPRTLAIVGDDTFAALACRYLVQITFHRWPRPTLIVSAKYGCRHRGDRPGADDS